MIVDWIVNHQAYKMVKGRRLWEIMEAEGVARGRSAQSMHEHFKKFIYSQIHKKSLRIFSGPCEIWTTMMLLEPG